MGKRRIQTGFGARMKQFRHEQKIKIEDMSKRIGVSQGSLSDIENENFEPSLQTVVGFFKAFPELDKDYFLFGKKKGAK